MDADVARLRRDRRREEARTNQMDLEGEALPPVPTLACEGRAGGRHEPIIMSIARAAPLELLCPRCEARFRIEEIDR